MSYDTPKSRPHGLDKLQRFALSIMTVLTILTFVGANLHALLWQSSQWLVSTVLPSAVVALTNEERIENSEPPLVRSSVLDEAARMKAEHMAANEYFAHFSPDGVTPWHWFDEAGYVYAHAGENLAIHFTDSSEVVEAWMNSPAHRENIVSGKYTEIGVGTAKGTYDGYETVYVVQLFGTPAVQPSVPPADPPTLLVDADVPATPAVIETPEATDVTDPVSAEELVVPTMELETPVETEREEVGSALVESETSSVSEVVPEPDLVIQPEMPQEPPSVVAVVPEEPPIAVPVRELPELVEETGVAPQSAVVMLELPVIATSSGLAVASVVTQNPEVTHAGATLSTIFTQPNGLLQAVYSALGGFVVLLLLVSVVLEMRRLHMVQVTYGLLLLMAMGGLWFVNSILTSGAVIA
jgi:hypothetical protein